MRKVYITCVFLFFLLFPCVAKADGIVNYYIDATIEENGDLYVKELFELDGDFNGFERIIDYQNNHVMSFDGTVQSLYGSSIYNGSNLEILKVKAVDMSHVGFDDLYASGDLFTLVDSAQKGSYGKYTISHTSTGRKLLIYNPSHREKRGFYIEYKISNMAILHEDIAELGWNLFSDQLTEQVSHMEVRINIPTNQNLLRAWAHGPLQGNIRLNGNQQVIVVLDQFRAKTAIDVRLVFDCEAISQSDKMTDLKAFDTIIDIETKKANDANQQREEYYQQLEQKAIFQVEQVERTLCRSDYSIAFDSVSSLMSGSLKQSLEERLFIVLEKIEKKELVVHNIIQTIWISWTIGLVWLLFYVYKRYDREYISDFKGKYYRDFPATYGPATLGFLLHHEIQNQDLSASILECIQKKIIAFDEIPNKKKDYVFRKLIIQEESLSDTEKLLLEFLFYKKDSITLSELKKKAKQNYQTFIKKYTNWLQSAKKDAQKENFFEEHSSIKIKGSFYCIVGFFLCVGACIFDPYTAYTLNVVPFFLCFVYIGAIIYILCYRKKTKKGIEDYKKWMALKNFMNDFGMMDIKELPEITLWEKYLVYAVSLGCADKLSKTMKIKVQEMVKADGMMVDTMMDIHRFNHILYMNHVVNNTIHQVVRMASESQSIAHGNSSSGSGFGGGFSGGGGSFGGGGGGGRF